MSFSWCGSAANRVQQPTQLESLQISGCCEVFVPERDSLCEKGAVDGSASTPEDVARLEAEPRKE